jgi:hypothetical protein
MFAPIRGEVTLDYLFGTTRRGTMFIGPLAEPADIGHKAL